VPAPPNLPAALFRHAGSAPGEPWLFRAEGWDWRWHTWGEIARRVREQAAVFAGRPAGSRVEFLYTAEPDAVVLDLAIQAAGLVAVPVGGPPTRALTPGPSPAPSLPPSPGEGKKTRRNSFSGSASSPGEGGREGTGEEGRGGEGVGGAVVLRSGELIELSSAELIAMAERLGERIAPPGEREIVVLGGPLEDPDERAMLAWATVAGAAVVLEPNPSLRVATAAWVRPTVFHGTAAEIAALQKRMEKEARGRFRRRPRLPLRRLRTILVTGPEALRVEEEAFWSGRGVSVCRIAA
jgi:hypothetical protein